METINGIIKFLSIGNTAEVAPATGDLSNLIMIIIAVIALIVLFFTTFANKNNHLFGKQLSGVAVSSTKIIQICSVALLAVSLLVIAFTGIKAFASESFSMDDFEVTADLQNNTVNYSQSNLVNNSEDDMKIQSMALSKEASVDDNDAIWTIKYDDKIIYSGQATGKDVSVENVVVPAKETASLTLVAENLSAQKVNDLAKSGSVVSFTIKLDNNEVDYTVNHWKLDSEGNRPENPTDSETLKGKEGELTNAQAKTYDGYTALDFEQQVIKGDGSTIVNIEYGLNIKDLDIDGLHYFPVVTKFKEGTFYDNEKNVITPALDTGYEMSDLINASYYSGDASFTAVRSINNVSYDAVYGVGGSGAKDVDPSWATANLKAGDSVEKLTQELSPTSEPKINNIGLTTIWKVLNPDKSLDGFGGLGGFFWSCVAHDGDAAYSWASIALSETGEWYAYNRNIGNLICVCVSRGF